VGVTGRAGGPGDSDWHCGSVDDDGRHSSYFEREAKPRGVDTEGDVIP